MQGALRLAGRARGVDDERGVFRPRARRLEGVRLRGDPGVQIRCSVARPVSAQHELEIREEMPDPGDRGGAFGVGDDRAGAGITEPETQGVRAEQREERDGDAAELVDRDVAEGGLRRLREQDADPVAPLDAALAQEIGEPVRHAPQLTEAVVADRAVALREGERKPGRLRLRPLVAGVDAYVEELGNAPPELLLQLVVRRYLRKHGHHSRQGAAIL